MSPKRVFFILLGVSLVLAAAFVGVITYGKNLIVAEGETLKEVRLESAVLDKQSEALNQAKRDIAEYEDLEKIAKTVVPQDKDQARTVLELVALARQSSITVTGVSFPDSALGESGTRGKKTSASTDLTQLTPLDSPKGVYSMAIRIDTDPAQPVSYQQLIGFLERLENNRRTAQVSNIQITPDTENRSVLSFNLTLTSYVKP